MPGILTSANSESTSMLAQASSCVSRMAARVVDSAFSMKPAGSRPQPVARLDGAAAEQDAPSHSDNTADDDFRILVMDRFAACRHGAATSRPVVYEKRQVHRSVDSSSSELAYVDAFDSI